MFNISVCQIRPNFEPVMIVWSALFNKWATNFWTSRTKTKSKNSFSSSIPPSDVQAHLSTVATRTSSSTSSCNWWPSCQPSSTVPTPTLSSSTTDLLWAAKDFPTWTAARHLLSWTPKLQFRFPLLAKPTIFFRLALSAITLCQHIEEWTERTKVIWPSPSSTPA